MSELAATLVLDLDIAVEVQITSDSPDNVGGDPVIDINSIDGGEPSDIVYAAVNANGLTGISGGTP